MHWTRANAEEIFPAAITPMTWSLVGEAGERGWRASFIDAGIFRKSERDCPTDPSQRAWSIFFGRPAFNYAYLKYFAFAAFSSTDPDALALRSRETPSMRANRLARTLYSLVFLPWRLRRLRAESEEWWRSRSNPNWLSDPHRAVAALEEAKQNYERVSRLHVLNSTIPVAWAYALVGVLSQRAGVPDLASTVLAGFRSLEEIRLAQALWEVSRGKSSMSSFLDKFGFHGPMESELSSQSWREEPAPILDLVGNVTVTLEDNEPVVAERRRQTERRAAERQVFQKLPMPSRLWSRLALITVRRYVPLRQVGKACLVQSIDVARAAARSIGRELHRQGRLAEPDDVFFLTIREAVDAVQTPQGLLQPLVAWRRDRRANYLTKEIPREFYGVPEPTAKDGPMDGANAPCHTLRGQGVSSGIVEGRARVLTSALSTIEPGEILVSAFTDPGWTALLVVAGAVVLDVGGSMSHGAIIARELGIPCVLGTGSATKEIRTGDRLRVDGAQGVVEVLDRGAGPLGISLDA